MNVALWLIPQGSSRCHMINVPHRTNTKQKHSLEKTRGKQTGTTYRADKLRKGNKKAGKGRSLQHGIRWTSLAGEKRTHTPFENKKGVGTLGGYPVRPHYLLSSSAIYVHDVEELMNKSVDYSIRYVAIKSVPIYDADNRRIWSPRPAVHKRVDERLTDRLTSKRRSGPQKRDKISRAVSMRWVYNTVLSSPPDYLWLTHFYQHQPKISAQPEVYEGPSGKVECTHDHAFHSHQTIDLESL